LRPLAIAILESDCSLRTIRLHARWRRSSMA
jgi:hypothetical protein